MAQKEFICGIDLDGTLLDDERKIQKSIIPLLRDSLSRFKEHSYLCTCTGNDLTFTRRGLPSEIFELFDAHILEMGCTASYNGIDEEVYIDPETTAFMKSLEPELNWVPGTYMERRLAAVTLFAEKVTPEYVYEIACHVDKFIKEKGISDKVYYRCSNIAVDIVPLGFSKFKGITRAGERLGADKVIVIADSAGDIELIESSMYAGLPSNATRQLIDTISKPEFLRKLMPLNKAGGISKNEVLIASKPFAEGVAEILDYISNVL